MATGEILYEVAENVATITLNRPAALNAMTRTMMYDFIDLFDEIDRDDNVRAVVVTGAGRGFCAGGDLSTGAAIFDAETRIQRGGPDFGNPRRADGSFDYSSEASRDGGGRLALRIFRCLKPIIGAINGPGVGVGASMVLPMDIRIASDQARLGFVYARRGVAYECCASWFLPRIVGIAKALELSLTGHILPAQELKAAGLVSEVVSPQELLPRAYEIARTICENTAPVSVALMRQMAWRSLGMADPMEAHRIESWALCSRGASADPKEGVESFLEKRLPNFSCNVSTDMPDFFPWWDEVPYPS